MDVYYPGIAAGDAATIGTDGTVSAIVTPNANYQVYELDDKTFSTPLTIKTPSGLTDTKVPVGNLPIFPDVYVVSPNYSHNWKSGDLVFRRDSDDAKDKAVATAVAAAQAALAAVPAAVQDAVTAQAIAAVAVILNAEVDGSYLPRPNAPVVAWVGHSNPNDFMGPHDYWVNLAEPPALSFADIRAELLSPGSALSAAAATAAAAKALLWVPAAQFVASIAAPTLNGAPSAYLSSAPVWRLDPNTTEGVSASVVVPAGWNAAQATLYWMPLGTSGGSVRTVLTMNSLVPGAQVSDATQALEFNMIAPAASGAVDANTPPNSNSFNVNPDRPLRIAVARRADHASDTNTDDIGFVGLMLRRLT